VAPEAERLRVLLSPAGTPTGSLQLFFDDIGLQASGEELLRNRSGEVAKRRWEGWAAGYLRLPPWFVRGILDRSSYDISSLKRYALYGAATFAGFWGNFGWLTLPMPYWAYVLPALATIGAGSGLLWLRSVLPKREQRDAATLLLLQAVLVSAVAFLPMIGRMWQPQGRHLFSGLVSWALLSVTGWLGWGQRFGWRFWWLVPGLGMILWNVAAMLGVVLLAYCW
jgi:hypothetical protein